MMNHEMLEIPMGDVSRGILEAAKKKMETEKINPENVGIISQNFGAEIATAVALAESSRGKSEAKKLAQYLKDDLETGMRDLVGSEIAQPVLEYLRDYIQEQTE